MAFVIGLLLTGALIGCLFLLHQVLRTPFLPWDLADLIIALTPGPVATRSIELLGFWAQRLLKLVGLIAVLAAGGLAAWATHAAGQRRAWPRVAAMWAVVMVGILLAQVGVGWRSPARPVGQLLVAAACLGWAVALVWAVDRWAGLTVVTTEPDLVHSRRTFLRRIALAAAGVTVSGLLGARLRPAGPIPAELPPPTTEPPPAPSPAPAAAAKATIKATSAVVSTVAPSTAQPPTLAPLQLPATPAPGTPLPPFEPAPGTRPNLTPLEDFYVVDISVADPQIDVAEWRLAVKGLVDRPLTLSFEDLLALPRVDVYATLECISNPVGGSLISTTLFTGCRLADVLARAGPQRAGRELVLRTHDRYDESIAMNKALDPGTLLVYGMDGRILTQTHGYPLRLYNPNHFGVKNPKWLRELEVVSEPHEGYWVRLGWDPEAVVKTTSVFDAAGQVSVSNGVARLGGIAFAGARGIREVGVQIDDGPFVPAQLDRPLSPLTWVRWRFDWKGATPGVHVLTVRAIDGTGTEQDSARMPPHPEGASGWHRVRLTLSGE